MGMKNYLKEMLVTLADAGVEFVVGGGVACVLHGVERITSISTLRCK
jgi:hypothetical protein